jgi:hypothetical protein
MSAEATRRTSAGGEMGIFTRKSKEETDAQIDLRDDMVVDLTGAEASVQESRIEWGFPSRCPDCGDYGYLDRIDVVKEVMYQHCPTCWAKWETHRSETADA